MAAASANRAHRDQYPHTLGAKDHDTGREAAIHYAPKAITRRDQVRTALLAGPATAEEIGQRIDLHWYLTRPRLSELKAMGEVVQTGQRGEGALGGSVNVWRLTTASERADHKARLAARVKAMVALL